MHLRRTALVSRSPVGGSGGNWLYDPSASQRSLLMSTVSCFVYMSRRKCPRGPPIEWSCRRFPKSSTRHEWSEYNRIPARVLPDRLEVRREVLQEWSGIEQPDLEVGLGDETLPSPGSVFEAELTGLCDNNSLIL